MALPSIWSIDAVIVCLWHGVVSDPFYHAAKGYQIIGFFGPYPLLTPIKHTVTEVLHDLIGGRYEDHAGCVSHGFKDTLTFFGKIIKSSGKEAKQDVGRTLKTV